MGVIRVILLLILALGAGYLFGACTASHHIVEFHSNNMTMEVRDDRFKKCSEVETTGRPNGSSEQLWNCKKGQVYIVRKFKPQ